jgi:hypothetical protein
MITPRITLDVAGYRTAAQDELVKGPGRRRQVDAGVA